MKTLTPKQLESRKARAVRFTRDVRGDDDRADEIEDESLEDYAEERHIKLANPKGVKKMSIPTRRELQGRIQELEAENEDLQSRLDGISDIVGCDDEGAEEEPEEEEEEQGE